MCSGKTSNPVIVKATARKYLILAAEKYKIRSVKATLSLYDAYFLHKLSFSLVPYAVLEEK